MRAPRRTSIAAPACCCCTCTCPPAPPIGCHALPPRLHPDHTSDPDSATSRPPCHGEKEWSRGLLWVSGAGGGLDCGRRRCTSGRDLAAEPCSPGHCGALRASRLSAPAPTLTRQTWALPLTNPPAFETPPTASPPSFQEQAQSAHPPARPSSPPTFLFAPGARAVAQTPHRPPGARVVAGSTTQPPLHPRRLWDGSSPPSPQGYRAVPTHDLPGGGGLSADGGFSPAAVTSCAVSVLRFLRSNCTREAGTYWLVRRAGGEELELYDISEIGMEMTRGHKAAAGEAAPSGDGADDGSSADGDNGSPEPWSVGPADRSEADSDPDSSLGTEAPPAAATFHPFAEPVALLCWRIAERLSPAVPDEAKRRRTLLESCVSLLSTRAGSGARQQLPMVAAAQEGLADGWLLEAHQLMPLPP
eukprot:scaffold25556_cov70-Isochrysis_galbana.AAC.1